MILLRLLNISNLPRTGWTRQIAVPLHRRTWPVEATFLAGDKTFRAVRGEDVGDHSATYRIHATMAGGESMLGELIDKPHPHKPVTVHRWVLDDLKALVPIVTVRTPGAYVDEVFACDEIVSPLTPLSTSPIHTRFHFRSRNVATGLYQDIYADVLDGDPVIHLWGAATWSDTLRKDRTIAFDLVGISSGEELQIDHRDANGWTQFEHDGKKVVLFGLNVPFLDGGAIPFRGSILAFRGPDAALPWTPDSEDEREAKNLLAARQGPMIGLCTEWDGSWLCTQRVPHPSGWRGCPTPAGGMFARRPIGCSLTPGQTGDQEDFGATKGTAAVSENEVRWIYNAAWHVDADFFRGVRHFEQDGSPYDPAKHPNHVTWSGRTHYHQGVSPDTLGKEGSWWPTNPMGGYEGYDDEHRSQNNLFAVIALTGDPILQDHLCHHLATDAASYTVRFSTTAASRAEGRLSAAWAHAALLLSGEPKRRAVEMLGRRIVLADQHPALNTAGPVKTIAMHGPDGRKPIRDAAGQLMPTWTVWEHALHALGVLLATNSGQVDLPRAQSVLVRLCRTLADFGCYEKAPGVWAIVQDIAWYADGRAVPLGAGFDTADTNAGDVRSWTMVGLLVARKVLKDVDPERATKLERCIVAHGIELHEPPNQKAAEWWAAVR